MSTGTVRAKFKVSEIVERHFNPTYSQKTIVLTPEYDQKIAWSSGVHARPRFKKKDY